MTDYEYIVQQVKKAHYSGWNDEELRKCVDMLPTFSREEQLALYRSKWIEHEKTLKDAIFNLLFKERIGERDRKIKAMNRDEMERTVHNIYEMGPKSLWETQLLTLMLTSFALILEQ